MQQDRLAELRRAKSTDSERAQLKKKLLSVTGQRADIAQQYAVRTHWGTNGFMAADNAYS